MTEEQLEAKLTAFMEQYDAKIDAQVEATGEDRETVVKSALKKEFAKILKKEEEKVGWSWGFEDETSSTEEASSTSSTEEPEPTENPECSSLNGCCNEGGDEFCAGFADYCEGEDNQNVRDKCAKTCGVCARPKKCVDCVCFGWDGSNYSNCHEGPCTSGYCVKCENDGKTPMPGLYTKHPAECENYEDSGLPTCSCAGGNQQGTSEGDKVCEWNGGNCSKFREGCDKPCIMKKEEECQCVTEWKSDDCADPTELQEGCPRVACDGPEETRWCLVANPGCAQEIDGEGWMECDDNTPVVGKAEVEVAGLFDETSTTESESTTTTEEAEATQNPECDTGNGCCNLGGDDFCSGFADYCEGEDNQNVRDRCAKTCGVCSTAYTFLHEGHCAGGWAGYNTFQPTVESCASHCGASRGLQFFAFCDEADPNDCDHGVNCACYSQCPDDDHWPQYKAYQITSGQSETGVGMAQCMTDADCASTEWCGKLFPGHGFCLKRRSQASIAMTEAGNDTVESALVYGFAFIGLAAIVQIVWKKYKPAEYSQITEPQEV